MQFAPDSARSANALGWVVWSLINSFRGVNGASPGGVEDIVGVAVVSVD